jgi:glycosyltransferase involved in cell wall biosynthesis
MSKIRVVHHSKTVGFSGTDRTAQLFAKYLAQSDKYEPFIVYREGDPANNRLEIVKSWLGADHVIPYQWTPGKKGQQPPYLPESDNLYDVLKGIDPQIMHVHRSGYTEWPCFRYMAPKAKWIETNIFGYKDNAPEPQIDLHIYISQYIQNTALQAGGPNGPVLYNPIEMPVLDMMPENKEACREHLLSTFKLPHNAVILGRVGRADNFDPIALKAFKEVEAVHPEAYYIVVNPCQGWHDTVRQLGIKNVRFSGPIVNDDELSKFYLGLDIYAHARHDGECCPCNIQEAMMHGIPVISHESMIFNGQSEILADSGFVVPVGHHEAYRDVMMQLVENPEMATEDEKGRIRLRSHFSRESRRRAMRHFEASVVTGQLMQMYDWTLKNK